MANRKGYARGGVMLAAAALVLVSFVSPAFAQSPGAATAALLSRAQIEDVLTDYYSLFGGDDRGFGSFYSEDAVLDVNGIVAHGRKPIDALYKTIPPDHGKVNVIFTNLKIAVRGDAASYHLVWTEFISDSVTALPRILEQGSDHGKLVKHDAKWLISCRVVRNDGGLPNDLLKGYEKGRATDVCR
jgi:hypothetical protein